MKSILFSVPILMLVAFSALAQSSKPLPLIVDKASFPPDMTEADRTQVINTAQNILDRYNHLATFLDTTYKSPRVTQKSTRAYESLFVPNAKVYKDIAQFPPITLMDNSDYADIIFDRLELQGVEFEITQAELLEVVKTQSGNLQTTVRISKTLYNYLSTEGLSGKSASGIEYRLNMIINIPVNQLDYGRIIKIERGCIGKECRTADNYVRYFGLEGTLGFTSASATLTDAFLQKNTPTDISIQAGPRIAVGLSWRSNKLAPPKSKMKNLFLAFGASASFLKIETALNGYSIPDFTAIATGKDAKQSYIRIVDSVMGTQTDKLTMLEIPLGISYRVLNKQKTAIFLDIQFVPQFALSSKSGFEGNARYDGKLPAAKFRFLEDKSTDPVWLNAQPSDPNNPLASYHVGRKVNLDYPETDITTGFGYSLRLSPVFYFNIGSDNPSWNLMVGIDYALNLKSPIKHSDPTGRTLAFENNSVKEHESDGLSNSILQVFSTRSRFSSIGLRIGVCNRLISKP